MSTATILASFALQLTVSASPDAAASKGGVQLDLQPTPGLSLVQLPSDGTVGGGAKALAEAITRGFRSMSKPPAFHRVAISTFAEVGSETSRLELGRVVAELMSVELAQRPPFVVVERDRLDQVMREHRLADLGVIDEGTVSKFGKILGAESLVSGTVSAVGPRFLVTIRQVDVESGRVLSSGQVSFDAAGMVALSEDAVVLRTRTDALFRSAVLPGWGQVYNDEPVKGAAFFALAVGAIGTAGAFYVAANDAHSAYQTDTPGVVGELQTANDRIAIANALLIGAGVVWAINLADAYLSGEDGTSITIPEPPSSGAAFSF